MSPSATFMRALRLHAQHDIRLEQVPIPPCGANQIRIKPAVVGICGTDVHEWNRGPTLIPIKPHPLTKCKVPITLGHEICGVVDEVGTDVEDILPGQRVAVQPIVADYTCRACLQGKINICRQQAFMGLSRDGGLADYVVVGRENVEKLPSHVPLEIGALIEPIAVGWHAVRLSAVDIPGVSALILGAGPIGLGVVQVLAMRGARNIIVCEPSECKRRLATAFGATHVFDPRIRDVPVECRKICCEEGVHVAFDCVGKQVTLDQAIEATGTGGTIVNIAIWGGTATISPNVFALGEKKFVGSSVYTRLDFQEVVEAIAKGQITPAKMITSVVSLDNVVRDGIKGCLIDNCETHVKVLVDMSL